MRLIALLIPIALAGCQTSSGASGCRGQAFALNQGRWQPTTADLKACTNVKGARR